jgi:hypothetical protein
MLRYYKRKRNPSHLYLAWEITNVQIILLSALAASLNLRPICLFVCVCVCVCVWGQRGRDSALNAAEVCVYNPSKQGRQSPQSTNHGSNRCCQSVNTVRPADDFHCTRSEEFCRTQRRSIYAQQKPGEVFVTVVQFRQHRCYKEFMINRSSVLHILQ